MKIDPNAPAYPVPSYVNADGETFDSSVQGMSIRAAMATQILGGMNAMKDERVWRSDSGESVEVWRKRIFAEDAAFAVMQADALIDALNGDKP